MVQWILSHRQKVKKEYFFRKSQRKKDFDGKFCVIEFIGEWVIL
jgi:hypothetical protein